MEDDSSCWWVIKVYDPKSKSRTTLNRFGVLDEIIQELNDEGYWQFVSAREEGENQ
jgi:hypothetical protein